MDADTYDEIQAEIAELRTALDNERANASDLRQNCTRVIAEIERLQAALRPFAEMADQVDEWQKGAEAKVDVSFSADDLRRAREALEQSVGEGK